MDAGLKEFIILIKGRIFWVEHHSESRISRCTKWPNSIVYTVRIQNVHIESETMYNYASYPHTHPPTFSSLAGGTLAGRPFEDPAC